MPGARFVALDRDGTLIEEQHYLSDPDKVRLAPGAAQGLRLLREMGVGLVVLTNQSAVGRGFLDMARLELIHQRLLSLLEAEGVRLDGIYYCPHTPQDDCLCRKPSPGLMELAAAELGFDPKECFVIGDKPCDIELGQRVGAITFLAQTGYGAQVAREATASPDYTVADLQEAAQVIQRILNDRGEELGE